MYLWVGSRGGDYDGKRVMKESGEDSQVEETQRSGSTLEAFSLLCGFSVGHGLYMYTWAARTVLDRMCGWGWRLSDLFCLYRI